MDVSSEFLFQLIKVSLGNADKLSRPLSDREWVDLYDSVEKQSLIGICSVGVQKLPKEQLPYIDMLMQWIGQTERICSRNKQMNESCVQLQNRLDDDGIKYCILKGQGVASYYGGLALYRQAGDIDVWISGGFDTVVGYVNKKSRTNRVQDTHVNLELFDNVEVEAHFLPTKLPNRFSNRLLRIWLDSQEKVQMENIMPFGKSKLHVPTVEFNLVYLLLHIYKHLFGEGIGLRQLMDYFFVLKTADIDENARRKVTETISSLGLTSFAKGIMWVLHKAFGMDKSIALWTPDENHGIFLMSEVLQMGNFGHHDERYRLSKDDSHFMRYMQMLQSKFRFLRYYPSEVFWQPIDIFIKFLRIRLLRRKVRTILSKNK